MSEFQLDEGGLEIFDDFGRDDVGIGRSIQFSNPLTFSVAFILGSAFIVAHAVLRN